MVFIDPETGLALENWLRQLNPGISDMEIKALIHAKYRGIRLESLPTKKAVFIFDSALINTQSAINMLEAATQGSWLPLMQKRLNMVKTMEDLQRFRTLIEYISSLEVEKLYERKRNSKSEQEKVSNC
jgi:hypothetical protein